jgi:uncharacterized membrane protein YheB (UPF0754 family)
VTAEAYAYAPKRRRSWDLHGTIIQKPRPPALKNPASRWAPQREPVVIYKGLFPYVNTGVNGGVERVVSYRAMYLDLKREYERLKREYESLLERVRELEKRLENTLTPEEAEELKKYVERVEKLKVKELLQDQEFRAWLKGTIEQELFDNLGDIVEKIVEGVVEYISEAITEKLEPALKETLPKIIEKIDFESAIVEYLEEKL